MRCVECQKILTPTTIAPGTKTPFEVRELARQRRVGLGLDGKSHDHSSDVAVTDWACPEGHHLIAATTVRCWCGYAP